MVFDPFRPTGRARGRGAPGDDGRDERAGHGRLPEGKAVLDGAVRAAAVRRAARVFKRVSVLGDISPFWVSEGGLEPPCPLRALAPQASASAYSATRTRDARGTHRLSYLSKPNAPRRVPRQSESCPAMPYVPVSPADPRFPSFAPAVSPPCHQPTRAPPLQHGCLVPVVPARRRPAQVGHLQGQCAGSGLTPGTRALPAHFRDRRTPVPLPQPARPYDVVAAAMLLERNAADRNITPP